MRFLTREWLKIANDDLLAIEELINNENLTHIASFHAEQALEKVFKALLEEQKIAIPKTHDIRKLHKMVESFLPLNDEQLEILLTINELYVESRYPGELGLLPYGKPTRKDAKAFYEFAREIYHDAMRVLESRGSQTEGEQ